MWSNLTNIIYERYELLAFLPAVSYAYLFILTGNRVFLWIAIFFSVFGAISAIHIFLSVEGNQSSGGLSMIGKIMYFGLGSGVGSGTIFLWQNIRHIPGKITLMEVSTVTLLLTNISVFVGFLYLILSLEWIDY